MTGTVVRPTGPARTASVADVLAGGARSGDLRGSAGLRFALGCTPLDTELQGGLRPGSLLVLAGRPGAGKTALTMQWSRNLARAGHAVVHACYEHDADDLVARLQLADDVERSYGMAGLDTYADRLHLLQGGVAPPGLAGLDEILAGLSVPGAGTGTVLVVDYLQKVPHDGGLPEAERVTRVVEGLKDLAMTQGIAVIAVVAADREGLTAPRLRLHHLRGSTAMAYEGDVVLVLDEKVHVVSRAHLAYDAVRAREFTHEVVLTVEKNRSGLAPVDMEFRKDLAHFRFDPDGRYVAERLVDERFVDA